MHPRELSDSELAAWCAICDRRDELGSPYFRPEFTIAVAARRQDVRVTVASDDRGPVGFFPHQRGAFGVGKPVAGPLSDFHGLIAEPGSGVDANDLIRASRLRSWAFDHLLATDDVFSGCGLSRATSPQIDLAAGYEAYVANRRAAGSDYIKKTEGLARKVEREIGPIRFEPLVTDAAVLRKLIEWKQEQYREAKTADVFGVPWTGLLLGDLVGTDREEFGGVLSALWFGDKLVASHMGMRSRRVLHYWFPAYEASLGKFSPGIILLLRLAEWASGRGIRTIDLGKGESQYKQRLATNAIELVEGRVELGSLAPSVRRIRLAAEEAAAAGGLGAALRLPLRVIRKLEFVRKFR